MESKNDFKEDIEREEFIWTEDIVRHLLRAEDDIRNGRTIDAREVFKRLDKKYGFKSEFL